MLAPLYYIRNQIVKKQFTSDQVNSQYNGMKAEEKAKAAKEKKEAKEI
jgi:hypothetical protein